jgi:hypothetical protein
MEIRFQGAAQSDFCHELPPWLGHVQRIGLSRAAAHTIYTQAITIVMQVDNSQLLATINGTGSEENRGKV